MTLPAAPNIQAGSPFAQLPAEVLTRITRWIPTVDLSAVRQTCKVIERKTFASWSHEFFRKRQFWISTFSLQTLLDIAQHEHLGPMLKHVCIATDRAVEVYTATVANTVVTRRARQDQDYLLNTGVWIEMLTEAFKKLPNLETIDIRDFSSATRFRDGPNAQWYSYGSTTLYKASGVRPQQGSAHIDFDRVFQGVVVAAGRAELSAPNLEVITRSVALKDAFYVSPAIKPAVAEYLGQLKKLHLVLRVSAPEELEDFLHLAKNVTWLRVNYFDRHFDPKAFLEWLGTPCNNDTMDDWAKAVAIATQKDEGLPIAPLNLPLDSLELGGCTTSPEVLKGIVAKLPLRSLSLRRVQLNHPKSQDKGLWADFLESLEGSGIRRLLLSDVTESTGPGIYGQPVIFKKAYKPRELSLPARRYRSEMFKSAAADTEVEPPPVFDSDEDNSDEDEDDDEEDEDGENDDEDAEDDVDEVDDDDDVDMA